ncbi:DNA topoisomerase IB [Legionella hackeliae]|uniref:DNA topoisomerase n=1 Tax=Legionella hackeliae TaxID=449 RepID=A0A0A8UU36_LEGHA|nr:DNA topoisomerase IB [Legionella hackeliae]KTD09647.1 Eukaryotic DNA topoisomerase I, catalytic core [Legionella hackeliae]CEK11036.1 DNA topoisomerase [Legionella hackeliae]STX47780.1 Eukaryotic DNA topoisomerase I, catalytic core [Legionella hackeliae]
MEISLYSVEECEKIAKNASLRYVNDSLSGISRKRSGKNFSYYYPDGTRVTDLKELKRIQELAIPPAYHDVWICPFPNGHIQATARDDRNRKQYRYHSLWQEIRQQQKFHMMTNFGKALPAIRKHVNQVLNKPPSLDKTQIICAIIYLLDKSCMRIGNTVYAKENQSYGLTTLRKKHLSITEDQVSLDFEGKNATHWHIDLKDRKIVKVLKKCEEIPGYEIFKYIDENKNIKVVTSQEINGYLYALTKKPFTAKDFRTWIACREILYGLVKLTKTEKKPTAKLLNEALKEVAQLLGHTPAICQRNYIHPQILHDWRHGKLHQWATKNRRYINTLDKDKLLLYWLKKHNKLSNGPY